MEIKLTELAQAVLAAQENKKMKERKNMINFEKGQCITLEKGISKVRVGIGWDVNAGAGSDYDLDDMVKELK